jgi:tetratricopeptide (TPR) repeat protein
MPFQHFLNSFSLRSTTSWLILGGCVLAVSGCSPNAVYKKSVGELNQKAEALMQQGKYPEAVGRLESALDLDPGEQHTLFNLAIAYQASGKLDQSIAAFEKLLETSPIQKTSIQQSLAVVCEDKADLLSSQVPSLDQQQEGPKKPLQANQRQALEQAIAYYQKALGVYETLSKEKPLPENLNGEELQKHLTYLKDRITKLEIAKTAE